MKLWLDLGNPSAERLHRASKASGRVVVVTYDSPSRLRQSVAGERIHRAEFIEVVAIPTSLLDGLAEVTSRHASWDVVHTGGQLYVTAGSRSFEGAIVREPLAGSG